MVAVPLLRVAARIRRGSAFDPTSVRSLRWIALTLIVGAVAIPLAGSIANPVVMEGALVDPPLTITVLTSSQIAFLLAGLLVAMLAEAVGRG